MKDRFFYNYIFFLIIEEGNIIYKNNDIKIEVLKFYKNFMEVMKNGFRVI